MSEDFRKAVAYWLLAIFDIDFVESYNEDSGVTKTTPLPQYYTARNLYVVQCIQANKNVKDIDSYVQAIEKITTYGKFLEQTMKGMSVLWKKEISNFKPLD